MQAQIVVIFVPASPSRVPGTDFAYCLRTAPTLWSRKWEKVSTTGGQKIHGGFIGFLPPLCTIDSVANTDAVLESSMTSSLVTEAERIIWISQGHLTLLLTKADTYASQRQVPSAWFIRDSSDDNIDTSWGYHWRSWPGGVHCIPKMRVSRVMFNPFKQTY